MGKRTGKCRDENSDQNRPNEARAVRGEESNVGNREKWVKGVSKYGEHDGEVSEAIQANGEPIRDATGGESHRNDEGNSEFNKRFYPLVRAVTIHIDHFRPRLLPLHWVPLPVFLLVSQDCSMSTS